MDKRLFYCVIIIFSFTLCEKLIADTYHTLATGETLYRLSRTYHVSVEELKRVNGIQDVTELWVGMKIRIPGNGESSDGTNALYGSYLVQRGDTLYGISRDRGMSLDELCSLNGISSNEVLKIGQILKVAGVVVTPVINDQQELTGTAVAAGTEQGFSAGESNYFWPHNGTRINLDGKLVGREITANDGDPVLSVSSGKVIWVAPYHGYGKIVMIESPDKHIFAYGGNGDTLVNVGDAVAPGQKIGLTGTAGKDSPAKIYFFVYKNGKPVDPELAPRK